MYDDFDLGQIDELDEHYEDVFDEDDEALWEDDVEEDYYGSDRYYEDGYEAGRSPDEW